MNQQPLNGFETMELARTISSEIYDQHISSTITANDQAWNIDVKIQEHIARIISEGLSSYILVPKHKPVSND